MRDLTLWNTITLWNCYFITSIREHRKKEFKIASMASVISVKKFHIVKKLSLAYLCHSLMVRLLLFALKKFICFQWLHRNQGCLAYNSNMWKSDLYITFDQFYLELPRVTICKSFIKRHFTCGSPVYYQCYVTRCYAACNIAFPIAAAVRGFFREKLYEEVGLKTL